MKLLKIRLCPFAGLPDVTIDFDSNLTVVQGVNEAGKSTVFNALDSILFTRTDLTPAKRRDFITPYVPVGGGDTIAVELLFSHGGKEYKLRRQWGVNSTAQLTLPDGNLVTSEEAITQALEPMLVTGPGTYRSVLMAPQTGLANTLNALKEPGSTTVQDLSNLLTSAVQETDGVSVDTFVNKLDSLYEEFFSRWDTVRNAPEGGKGLQNRWKNRVGRVLQAWYDKETVREARDAATAAEEKVDALNKEVTTLSAACADLSRFIKNNADAVHSASERKALEAREALLAEQIKVHKQANSEWPVLENDVTQLKAKEAKWTATVVTLQREKDLAARIDAMKGRVAQLQRVRQKKLQLDEARKTLESTPALTSDQLEEIQKTASHAKMLENALSAGRLKARITAKLPLTASLQCGVDAPTPKTLEKGATLDFEANGVFKLDHPEWTLAVESGTGNFSEIAKDLEQTRTALKDLLKAHLVKDEHDARHLNRNYEDARRAVTTAEQGLKAELGKQSYEELEQEAAGNGPVTTARPLVEVAEHLATTQGELEAIRKDLTSKQARLLELQNRYVSQDKLFEQVAEITAGQKELANKRGKLAPLPAGVTDVDVFVSEYRDKESSLKQQTEMRQKLELEKAGVHLPEESAEELSTQYEDRLEAFDAVMRKANAITRIRAVVTEVRNEVGAADPYVDLRTKLEGYIARLTGNRYQRIEMKDRLPSGFVRGDGVIIEAGLLSTGTKDVLGLALRLAMGGYFLGDKEGFLVMDDPLVDMDPGRQANAAALLREYAGTRQVIVFTCQPGHATILGGKKVELS